MPLVGGFGLLAIAFVTAVLADLTGNATTRAFTRPAFALVLLRTMGLTLSGVASFGADLWGLLPL